ncbi:putative armadillo-like helical protein [Plasmopara halstedii]
MDPFTELRKHAGGAHPQKAKLNVVLGATSDVIYERRASGDRQTPISPTEYFAALMTALDAVSDSHRQEVTQLLSMVLPEVPEAVLRLKFTAVAKCLTTVLQEAGDDAALLRSASACLALALLAQEPSTTAWGHPDLLRSFQLLFTLAMDSRHKVRKAGHKWTMDILELHSAKNCDILSTHIASFAENVFSSCKVGGHDDQRLVLLVAFLKSALPLLQRKVVASLVVTLAPFLDASSKTLRLVTYEALDALSTAPEAQLAADTLQKLVVAVLDAQSSSALDSQGGSIAVYAVRIPSEALRRLAAVNGEATHELLPRVVGAICSHIATDNDRVQGQATRSLLSVLKATLNSEMLETKDENVVRVLASLQSLTSLHFQSAWGHTFPLLAELFRFYGKACRPAFEPIILTCCELHEAADQLPQQQQKGKSAQALSQLFALAAGAAVEALGPRAFLEIVPIDHPTEIVSEQRAWLLPVFRDALRAAQCKSELSFFSDVVLPMACACEARARETSITPLQAKNFQTRTSQLWSLFPSVCASAVDIDTHFKKIAKVLASAMADKRYPDLRLAVCQGLQVLMKRTRALQNSIAHRYYREAQDIEVENDGNEDEEDNDEAGRLDEAKLARDRAALAKFSGRYVPLLLSFAEDLDPEKDADRAQVLLDTLEGFSALADAQLIGASFKLVMQKLLKATTEAKRVEGDGAGMNSKRSNKLRQVSHAQMALALALLAHVDDANVALLYRVIKPYLLDDSDASMQKRSYAALVAICDSHPKFLSEEVQLQDMTRAICESLLTCSVPAKKMRLRVLAHLIRALQTQPAADTLAEKELVPNLVGEIMLCAKEANGKAREAAFELLVAMATMLRARDPQNGIMEYIQMVLGGLAARTPHMRSAAVICLSRLVFEFGREDAAIAQAMPALLKTVLMLLHEKAREVIKSVIGFMKLGIAVLPKDQLEQFLPDIINGLLIWIGESKNRFRAKTRIILIKLCRKFGYEHVAALMPVEDRALIRHIKKTKERDDKKKSELSVKAAERRAAKKNHDSFGEFMADLDDENDVETAVMQVFKRKRDLHKKHKGGKVIREDEDDIVDFLDDNAAVKNVISAQRGGLDDESFEDFQTSKDGRLIIPGEDDNMDGFSGSDDENKIKQDVVSQLQRMGLHPNGKNVKGGRTKRKRDEDGSNGREYRAKKAGGDIKKKGKLEPYAYIPLDPKLMAKRNKREAVTRYGGSVGKRRGKK